MRNVSSASSTSSHSRIREDEERQQRQLDVEPQQDRHRAEQRQRALKQRHDAVGHERVERLHVVGHARDQLARLTALEEADRLGLQVSEDPQAQILQRALADPADELGLRVRRAPIDERADDERRDDEVQRADVAGHDPVVDRELGQWRRCERGCGRRDQREEHEHDPTAVGAQQRREPAQLAPAPAGRAQAAAQLGRRQRPAALGVLLGDRVARVRDLRSGRTHRPATSGSRGLRVRNTWSGRPFWTIS